MEAVTLSWELVQGLSTNAHDFWPALKGFISMAFHRKLLEMTNTEALAFKASLKQVIKFILTDLYGVWRSVNIKYLYYRYIVYKFCVF